MKKILFIVLIALSLGKEKVSAQTQYVIPGCGGQGIFCYIYNDTLTVVFHKEAGDVVNYKIGEKGESAWGGENISNPSTFSLPIAQEHGKEFSIIIWWGPDGEKTLNMRNHCGFQIP